MSRYASPARHNTTGLRSIAPFVVFYGLVCRSILLLNGQLPFGPENAEAQPTARRAAARSRSCSCSTIRLS
jgi:hypothetical protein